MKLVYILNQYSENESSHFHHIINLLDELAKNGVDIKLVIEKPWALPKFENKIEIIAQKNKNRFLRLFELFSILRNTSKQGYNKIFIRISSRAALVATFISKFYNITVYFWISGTTLEFDTQQHRSVKKFIWYFKTYLPIKIVMKQNILVTGPESMGDYYQKWFKIDSSNIIILNNDVDIDRFVRLSSNEKMALKLKLGYNENAQIILCVKRLSPVRRVDYYLPFIIERVANKLSGNFVFVIIGDGADKTKIKEAIEASGLSKHVHMLGNLPNKKIHDYYMAADIFINPTFAEGFPRVLLEAMACGLPIVTTDAGGIGDIIGEEQRRYLIKKKDRGDFASRLIALYHGLGEKKLLSDENLKISKRYSTQEIAKMYITKLYRST